VLELRVQSAQGCAVRHHPHARRLLLLADSGGSNGASPRAFKRFLQEKIADAHGLTVTVAHYPSGASTWNPIEHRMFSEITKTWAGHPLESTEILLRFAQDTSTTTGLRVTACLDERQYQKGLRVTDKEISSFDITRRDQLGKWNYQIAPRVAPEALIPSANRASRCWRQPRPSTAKV